MRRGWQSVGKVVAVIAGISLTILTACAIAPRNRITGEYMHRTYVSEWEQAIRQRGCANVPSSQTDYLIIGQAACEITGSLGTLYEFAGRDTTSLSVEFVGTPQSIELRQHLDRAFQELEAIEDLVAAGLEGRRQNASAQ